VRGQELSVATRGHAHLAGLKSGMWHLLSVNGTHGTGALAAQLWLHLSSAVAVRRASRLLASSPI
jgi:hypothetical protein